MVASILEHHEVQACSADMLSIAAQADVLLANWIQSVYRM
jgi:hypothetical protein